jgi:hypothetical protein
MKQKNFGMNWKKKIDKITNDKILKSYFSQKHENFNPPILNDNSCSENIKNTVKILKISKKNYPNTTSFPP